jgi:acetyltransferase-like isoleucine patch superfamily enzyme
MTRLKKVLQVAKEELAIGPRRIAAGAVSGILPQNSFNRARTALLRALGLRIGPSSLLAGSVHLTGSGPVRELLSVGRDCYLTGPLHIDLTAPVSIGDRVYMGYDVMLITADHELGESAQRCGRRVYRAICVEDGVWIGSRAVILPGVRLGRGSVVAAGAVVTRDVAPDTMVGGVPARLIRDLKDPVAGEARCERLAAMWSSAASEA